MLEEEEQGRGAEQGGVLSVELRFAEFRRLVGWGLGARVAGDWRRGGDCLVRWCCWGYSGGGSQVSG